MTGTSSGVAAVRGGRARFRAAKMGLSPLLSGPRDCKALRAALVLAGVLLSLATEAICRADDRREPPPVPIVLEPEMAGIGELNDWEHLTPEAAAGFAVHEKAIAARWDELRPWLKTRVTAAAVRRLSRWARPQMEGYLRVPLLEKAVFQPVRREPEGERLLYEATLDTLPTHHPLVTRWLKVYLVFDPTSKTVPKVIVTIRGEILE